MQDLRIAFDSKGMQEYFVKWKYTEYSGNLLKSYRKEIRVSSTKFYIFEKTNHVPRNMGVFFTKLFEFRFI